MVEEMDEVVVVVVVMVELLMSVLEETLLEEDSVLLLVLVYQSVGSGSVTVRVGSGSGSNVTFQWTRGRVQYVRPATTFPSQAAAKDLPSSRSPASSFPPQLR